MRSIDDKTYVSLGLVLMLLSTVAAGAVTGAFWVSGVNHELVEIKHSIAEIKKVIQSPVAVRLPTGTQVLSQ